MLKMKIVGYIKAITAAVDELTRHRMIRSFIGLVVKDLVTSTEAQLSKSAVKSNADIRHFPENLVRTSDAFLLPLEGLRNRLFEKLYRHHRVMRMALKAERILSELFEMYISNPKILPPSVTERTEEITLHRIVCDYIAGMTDRFALEEYEKMTDPHTKP